MTWPNSGIIQYIYSRFNNVGLIKGPTAYAIKKALVDLAFGKIKYNSVFL